MYSLRLAAECSRRVMIWADNARLMNLQTGPPCAPSNREGGADAGFDVAPVLLAQVTDYGQLRPMSRKHDTARPPAACQSRTTWSVDVAALGNFVVRVPAKTSGRSTRYVWLAIKLPPGGLWFPPHPPGDDIAGFQRGSSCSSSSSRRSEAAVNSRRSASDQESDQSIVVPRVRVAGRWARADNSLAVSAGRRRKASSRISSRALICTWIPS